MCLPFQIMRLINFVNTGNCSFVFKTANTCADVLQVFEGLPDKIHPLIIIKCTIRLYIYTYFRQFSKNFTRILGEKRGHFASSERS